MTKSVFTGKHDRFREMLVDARKKSGLTQVHLAERLSRPQSFVSKVERGERRLDVVEFFEFAQAIGVDPFAFLKSLNAADGLREGSARRENRARGKVNRVR